MAESERFKVISRGVSEATSQLSELINQVRLGQKVVSPDLMQQYSKVVQPFSLARFGGGESVLDSSLPPTDSAGFLRFVQSQRDRLDEFCEGTLSDMVTELTTLLTSSALQGSSVDNLLSTGSLTLDATIAAASNDFKTKSSGLKLDFPSADLQYKKIGLEAESTAARSFWRSKLDNAGVRPLVTTGTQFQVLPHLDQVVQWDMSSVTASATQETDLERKPALLGTKLLDVDTSNFASNAILGTSQITEAKCQTVWISANADVIPQNQVFANGTSKVKGIIHFKVKLGAEFIGNTNAVPTATVLNGTLAGIVTARWSVIVVTGSGNVTYPVPDPYYDNDSKYAWSDVRVVANVGDTIKLICNTAIQANSTDGTPENRAIALAGLHTIICDVDPGDVGIDSSTNFIDTLIAAHAPGNSNRAAIINSILPSQPFMQALDNLRIFEKYWINQVNGSATIYDAVFIDADGNAVFKDAFGADIKPLTNQDVYNIEFWRAVARDVSIDSITVRKMWNAFANRASVLMEIASHNCGFMKYLAGANEN
jgi:hypothetical protein